MLFLFFYVYNFLPSFMHFTSCYIERPQPELLVNIADSKSLFRRSVGIAIKSDGVVINDDVSDRESNETRIVLAL